MEYKSYLCRSDGMPPLWPRAPAWPNDLKVRSELLQEMAKKVRTPVHMLEFVIKANLNQRQIDQRWRHFNYLLKRLDPDEKKSIDEWSSQLLPITGWKDGNFRDRKQVVTAQEFGTQYQAFMALADQYNPPKPPIPNQCDECKAFCNSECLCGEIFCSRKCQRISWKAGHRKICEQVYDNGTFATMISQIEMENIMTQNEKDFAYGLIDEKQTAERAERRVLDGKILDNMVLNDPSPTLKSFTKLQKNQNGPILPDNTKNGIFVKDDSSKMKMMRENDPYYHEAANLWNKVYLYEFIEKLCENKNTAELISGLKETSFVKTGDECIIAFGRALQLDSTAVSLEIDLVGGGKNISQRYPRISAAIREAIKNRQIRPEVAANAYYIQAYFAMYDPSIGNAYTIINTLIEDKKLSCHLFNLPEAIMTRSGIRITLNSSYSAFQASADDCLLAIKLAEEKGDMGMVWTFYDAAAKAMLALGRDKECLVMREKYITIADAALAFVGVTSKDYYSGTGGREKDPHKLAKIVACQYDLATYYFTKSLEKGGTTPEGRGLGTKGREHYIAAGIKEEKLPLEILDNIAHAKTMCQAALAALPLQSKKTRALINPNCYICDTINAGFNCSQCMKVAYCSKECQKKHWKNGHKLECVKVER